MNKQTILNLVIAKLTDDLALTKKAALTAYDVATSDENIAENKYDTLSLEASYLARGQAKRVQELEEALSLYKHLILKEFCEHSPIYLSALVSLVDEDDCKKILFIGPTAGGINIEHEGQEITVISPNSPLGKCLMGNTAQNTIELGVAQTVKEYEITDVC
ncbi:transcription elongation factor GreAB [Deltaproteobacteria bacterium TL4]